MCATTVSHAKREPNADAPRGSTDAGSELCHHQTVDTEWQIEDGADAGGHHRLTEATLKPFLLKDKRKPAAESRQRFRRVSGRNQLAGSVVSIRIEGLLAEVVLSVGDTHVTAIITANAVRELQLKKGDSAAALIKSTDVMIERLDDPV